MNRKQVGVIYRAFKEGKLENVDKEDMSNVYAYLDRMNDFDFARKEGYEVIGYLKEAVDAILHGDYETADSKVRGFKTVEVF